MDRGRAICEELKRAGIHHIAWLPDSETHFMHDPMCSDPDITVTQVCREGEAVAFCGGLFLGGKRGAVMALEAAILAKNERNHLQLVVQDSVLALGSKIGKVSVARQYDLGGLALGTITHAQ